MGKKFAVIGFPKCGTMSLVQYLKNTVGGAEIIRPENIYNLDGDYNDYEYWCITRDPVERIKSIHQYFTEFRNMTVKQLVATRKENYFGVGAYDVIEQSNYMKYILKFEHKFKKGVNVVRFEDMINKDGFPHYNGSANKLEWTDSDRAYIKNHLEKHGIVY